jgi:hypothetical protein
MAIFVFTLTMSNGKGDYPIHQVIGQHDAKDCYELMEEIETERFITIDECYHKEKRTPDEHPLRSRGPVTIQTNLIGKIKLWYPSEK